MPVQRMHPVRWRLSLSEDVRGELYEPDIAVLGIGGIQVGAVRVVELPPADAATAAGWLGASTVIPVHHPPGDPAPAQLAAALESDARVSAIRGPIHPAEIRFLRHGVTHEARLW